LSEVGQERSLHGLTMFVFLHVLKHMKVSAARLFSPLLLLKLYHELFPSRSICISLF